MSNALKFTVRGSITVDVFVAHDNMSFKVKDTGVGIPDNDQHKLFTVFGKGSDDHGMNHKGNGLGLTIVKGIVERLGGQIRFQSRSGRGTTFYVNVYPHSIRVMNHIDPVSSSHVSGIIDELRVNIGDTDVKHQCVQTDTRVMSHHMQMAPMGDTCDVASP